MVGWGVIGVVLIGGYVGIPPRSTEDDGKSAATSAIHDHVTSDLEGAASRGAESAPIPETTRTESVIDGGLEPPTEPNDEAAPGTSSFTEEMVPRDKVIDALEQGAPVRWQAGKLSGYVIVSDPQTGTGELCRRADATLISGQEQRQIELGTFCHDSQNDGWSPD